MYLESTNLPLLEAMNLKINNAMKSKINGYVGTSWGTIKKHKTLEKWLLVINEDERLPLKSISNSEKLTLVDSVTLTDYFTYTE